MDVCDLLRRLPFNQLADRVLDNVINDVRERVIDTPRFLDFRLVLDLRLMASRQPNDLAEKLLVHLSEYVCGEDRKLVRTIGIIEIPDDLNERLVVDVEVQGERVGGFPSILFFLEMKQPGIVLLISPLELFAQALVGPLAIDKCLERPIRLDAAILADPKENDPVNGLLNGKVQFPL